MEVKMEQINYLGKRVLFNENYSNILLDAIVLEFSPSGNYVLLKLPNKDKFWRRIVGLTIIEELPDGRF